MPKSGETPGQHYPRLIDTNTPLTGTAHEADTKPHSPSQSAASDTGDEDNAENQENKRRRWREGRMPAPGALKSARAPLTTTTTTTRQRNPSTSAARLCPRMMENKSRTCINKSTGHRMREKQQLLRAILRSVETIGDAMRGAASFNQSAAKVFKGISAACPHRAAWTACEAGGCGGGRTAGGDVGGVMANLWRFVLLAARGIVGNNRALALTIIMHASALVLFWTTKIETANADLAPAPKEARDRAPAVRKYCPSKRIQSSSLRPSDGLHRFRCLVPRFNDECAAPPTSPSPTLEIAMGPRSRQNEHQAAIDRMRKRRMRLFSAQGLSARLSLFVLKSSKSGHYTIANTIESKIAKAASQELSNNLDGLLSLDNDITLQPILPMLRPILK
ncbi:hypothetical protein C8R45DRAFT_939576 [Mycena sanguinolenta]|nr:hypothetical protein C8R45DRAFT_939576 [Mycena sanguinolenta]